MLKMYGPGAAPREVALIDELREHGLFSARMVGGAVRLDYEDMHRLREILRAAR